jgi:ankyrin repeat protein
VGRRAIVATVFLALMALRSLFGAAGSMTLLDAVRRGDCQVVRRQLGEGADPNVRDDIDATALMNSAAFAPLDCVRALLDKGAGVNAVTKRGASALMWATSDRAKVQLLLERGANLDTKTADGTTALVSAARRGNIAAMQELLAHGADPRAGGDLGRGLLQIAYGGSACTVFAFGCNNAEMRRLLHGAGLDGSDPDQVGPMRPRAALADGGNLREFLDRGPDPNELESFGVLSVSPLAIAAFLGDLANTELLFERGADPNTKGTNDITPMMMAAASARPNAAVVRLLLDQGADVRARDSSGRTALDWALLQGETDSARVLAGAGAVVMAPLSPLVASVATPRTARQAVALAISRLQSVGPTFYQRGRCISCHNQSLPAIAVALARTHNVPIDEQLARHPTEATLAVWKAERENLMLGRCSLAGYVANVGYGLLGMAEEGATANSDTDAVTTCLAAMQRPDGSWRNMVDTRPPLLDSSPIPYTALAIRGLATYAPPALRVDTQARISRAREFLRNAQPRDTQDHVFKMLGLLWSSASTGEVLRESKALIALQRKNGGWGQWPTMEPDAYATGQALYALHAGGLAPGNAAYRNGAQFLVRTQLEDGTWFVQSRAFPLQPFFDSGFAHGRNQYISAASTAWAAIALEYTL